MIMLAVRNVIGTLNLSTLQPIRKCGSILRIKMRESKHKPMVKVKTTICMPLHLCVALDLPSLKFKSLWK